MSDSDMIYTLAKKITVVFVFILLMFSVSSVSAAEYVVIVNKHSSLSVITKSDLAHIFMGKKKLWDSGERISMGILHAENPQIVRFLKQVCNKTTKRFNAYWMKHVFSGSGVRPREFFSNNDAVQFVASRRHAIAVIDSSEVSNGVKIIEIVE